MKILDLLFPQLLWRAVINYKVTESKQKNNECLNILTSEIIANLINCIFEMDKYYSVGYLGHGADWLGLRDKNG